MKSNSSRSILMTVMVLMVFVFSAVMTAPAYADDSTPPPTDTSIELPPPVDVGSTPTAAPVPVVDESVTATPAPVVEESVPAVEETTADILAQVPEGTDVMVVNTDGEVLPLASKEAAQALVNGDPMWCPAGVAPGAASCTGSFNNFNGAGGLLAAINNKNVAGVIWVQNTYNSTGEGGVAIELNPGIVGTTANFSLTINGGWTGAGTAISGTSTFTVPLLITGWTGAITLNNIMINNANTAADDSTALNVVTSGNILLNNVTSTNNVNSDNPAYMRGAWLDNTSGTGNVTINKSSFNNNEFGLDVKSNGMITLANVLVNGNYFGATLNNSIAVTAKAVTITTGTNEFSNNAGGDGLNISSTGVITLKDITANDNGGDGIHLDNTAGSFVSGIKFTGTTITSGNGGDGIEALSDGAISASNLIANNNHNGWGVQLDNSTAATALAVTLTGNNEFKFNGGGLSIQSKGAITTNNVTALTDPTLFPGNESGVSLDNTSGTANVTMNGTNIFNGNHIHGLKILSNGMIKLNNVKAIGNVTGFGATLDNSSSSGPMPVTLNGTNIYSGNYSGGLEINSNGAVLINNPTASDNKHGNGLLIDNRGNSLVPQNVTLTIASTFKNNYGSGLIVDSYGAIMIANLTSDKNRQGEFTTLGTSFGAQLHNNGGSMPRPVTLTGNTHFISNDGTGLEIFSLGAISVNNIKSISSYGYGAYLNNQFSNAVGGVTITNPSNYAPFVFETGFFGSAPGLDGLRVLSYGNISITNVISSSNRGNGIYLDNYAGGTGSGNISLTTTRVGFINILQFNDLSGLVVRTNGTVTLSNIQAGDVDPIYGNGAYGADIQVFNITTPKAVTLTGTNSFSNNVSGGLKIITNGPITLNNVTADNNHNAANTAGGIGVQLDNIASTTAFPQNVTINGTNGFNGNYLDGLNVNTYGLVLLNNLTANDNSYGVGVLIRNEGSTLPKPVTLNGYGAFHNNRNGGLRIMTTGAITLNNVAANGNTAGYGVLLDNAHFGTSASPQNVTINGTNVFSGNYESGLFVVTRGAILTNNLTANFNGHGDPNQGGVYLDNALTPKAITLNGVNVINNNNSTGIFIFSKGTITVNKLDADQNVNGAWISNDFTGAIGGLNFTGWVYVEGNSFSGLRAFSRGAINIANLNINIGSPNGFGAVLENDSGTGNVTISGSSQIFGSATQGLVIWTNGSVTLSNMTVSGNGEGIVIDHRGGLATPQNVTLTGTNYFYNNTCFLAGPVCAGLKISADGAITINNLDVYGNTGYGVWLENCGYYITASACDPNWSAPKGITITGINSFVNNDQDGLWAVSKGAITISDMTANFNTGNGATLNNQWGTGSVGGITLKGINIFEQNDQKGLKVNSNGAITISNLSANLNKNDGVALDNQSLIKGVAVTLTGINTFTDNGTTATGSGLVILSDGQITLSNVTATGNKASGADLNNTTALLPLPGIKLTGVNIFNKNGSYGLKLQSNGFIDLINITADLNQLDGLNAVTTGKFTMTCSSLNNNADNGWDVIAGGLITLKGVYGFGNPSGNVPALPSASVIIIRACPVPAPVILKLIVDDDRAARGVKVKADLVYERK